MSKSQRDKGARRERELVKLLGAGAKRVPLSGACVGYKADVEWDAEVFGEDAIFDGDAFPRTVPLCIEVKSRAGAWKRLRDWLAPDYVDMLALKADNEPWLVVKIGRAHV